MYDYRLAQIAMLIGMLLGIFATCLVFILTRLI